MIKQVKALVKLQELDIEIKKLVNERMKISDPYEKEKQKCEQSELMLNQIEAELSELADKNSKLDKALNLEREKVRKWDARLKNIKSSRDYAAMQREIEIQKRINAEMEEEYLKNLEHEENLKKNYEAEKKIYEELLKAVKEEKAKMEENVVAVDSQIAEIQKERREILPEIDDSILKRYELIMQRKPMPVIAPLEDERCQGCFVQVRPQLANIIQTGQTLETCPHCNRFLYYRPLIEETEEAAEG